MGCLAAGERSPNVVSGTLRHEPACDQERSANRSPTTNESRLYSALVELHGTNLEAQSTVFYVARHSGTRAASEHIDRVDVYGPNHIFRYRERTGSLPHNPQQLVVRGVIQQDVEPEATANAGYRSGHGPQNAWGKSQPL